MASDAAVLFAMMDDIEHDHRIARTKRVRALAKLAMESLDSYETHGDSRSDKADFDLDMLAQACSDLRVRIAAGR